MDDLFKPKSINIPTVKPFKLDDQSISEPEFDIGQRVREAVDKLYISVIEQLDETIFGECVKVATAEGLATHIILNKKFIADAIREKLDGHSPMTWEEAIMDDCFLEFKGVEAIDGALNRFASSHDEPQPDDFIVFTTHETDELKLMRFSYGRKWRCWRKRPTDEERFDAAWEG